MDLNENLLDAQYKDASPIATVEKIRAILSSHSIETIEKWHTTSVPYCFALTIYIAGTTFSVNGKGMSKEFALASGYGELMERLQLGYTGAPGMQKDGSYSFDETKYVPVDLVTLAKDERKIFHRLSQKLHYQYGIDLPVSTMLHQFTNKVGMIPCANFYNITTQTPTPFPNEIRMRVYGSNGCAAGNTVEEAIVQAISEIVERHNQSEILREGIALPTIPEEELIRHEAAYRIISYVRNQGFRIIVKDCSLGQKFPVVCACFIHEKTGKYHTHFGAAPVFEIALERALTESFQGKNIATIAQFDDFLYNQSDITSLGSVTSEFAKGSWKKSPEFFLSHPELKYNANAGFQGQSNKELLKECVAYFRDMDLDILVYNSATLGFPTCHVLIPGYSEVFPHRLCVKIDDHRYYQHAITTLRNPSKATISDMLGLLMHIDQMAQFPADTIRAHGFLNAARLSADLTSRQSEWLMSASLGYVYYSLGRYSEAVKCIRSMLSVAEAEHQPYLIALSRVMQLRLAKYDDTFIQDLMEHFHSAELIDSVMCQHQNPFLPFVLHCDLNCYKDCPIYEQCCKIRVTELDSLINEQLKSLSFQDFSQQLSSLLN